MIKAIRIQITNIPRNERNLRSIKQYELDGDSKFVELDGSKTQVEEHEFQS
jgi:hypothetical protein